MWHSRLKRLLLKDIKTPMKDLPMHKRKVEYWVMLAQHLQVLEDK